MKVVFLSNYYNHHQSAFSTAMDELTDNNFYFIETSEMSEERRKLGYGIEKPSFVLQYYDEEQKNSCISLIDEADVVIYGSAPYNLVEKRLKGKKLTFAYSERLFKKGFSFAKWPVRTYKYGKLYGGRKNVYLLCASAYSPYDYNRLGVFKDKTFKWGYFPPTTKYENVDNVINSKTPNSILWCGRFIDLKHPEKPIEVIKRLKDDGYNVSLKFVGDGELREELENLVKKYGLEEQIEFVGFVKADKVRSYMEESKIFLFTSDRNEGWGAVLNESMNSACAVVASHAIGATPFLIKDNENGLIFKNQDVNDLYNKVKFLLDNEKECNRLSKNAYETMVNEWNAKNASKKLLELIESLQKDKKTDLFKDGVLSKAKVLKDNWYKN